MSGESLPAAYFDGIFASDDDPWDLAKSDYEAAKFAHTREVLADRRYAHAVEVGCAHGVLTRQLAPLCDSLLAIDISCEALAKAHERVSDLPGVTLRQMAFPQIRPDQIGFDLVVLSEVAYYWGRTDLQRASAWLRDHVAQNGRLLLVHYTGLTDYPHQGDETVEILRADLIIHFEVERAERRDGYRLDLWERR